jgi:hypothetical protein
LTPGARPVRLTGEVVTVWVVVAGEVVTTYDVAELLAVKPTVADVAVMALTLRSVGAAQAAAGAVMVKLAFEMSKK